MVNFKTHFSNFRYFYSFLGVRIFIGLFLSFLVGVADGLGIAMFFPLLEMMSSKGESGGPSSIGNFDFVFDFLESLSIYPSVNTLLVLILLLFLVKGLIKFLEGVFNMYLQQHFILAIRLQGINAIADLQYVHFLKIDPGKIQNTMSSEAARMIGAYRGFISFIQNLVLVFVYLVMAFTVDVSLSLLLVAGGGLSGVIFLSLHKKTESASKSLTHKGHVYHSLLGQSMRFFSYLKATGRISQYLKKMKHVTSDIERYNKKMGAIQAFIEAVREPMVLVIVISVLLIYTNYFDSTTGGVLLSLVFFYRSLNYVMASQSAWNRYLSTSGSFNNIRSFLLELEAGKEVYGDKDAVKFDGSIELRNVNFSYAQNAKVLDEFNLSIEKNRTYAFVGESGSGKSTLVKLIAGLLRPDSGEIIVDGTDSKDLNYRSFQNRVGYISQSPVVFDDTIFNNVTFWAEKNEANMKRFSEALRKAAMLEFVEKLDRKEDTFIGANGIQLSGGQEQRISIARELYKEIDILVMDEGTSSLDAETEEVIKTSIDNLKGSVTILLIAHRLVTIKEADIIVLIQKGKNVQQGSFNDLVSNNEYFKRLIELQSM